MTECNEKGNLRFDEVRIELAGKQLVYLNETVEPGEVLTIMGPSGSGKSSLLAYVAGFLEPDFSASGAVYLGSHEITSLAANQRHVGLLFQDALLFPHMSVGDNLLFALPAALKGKMQRKQAALEALENAGLGEFFDRDPATLSGGQKARVALARIMLSCPRALLLDEPFSRLDQNMRSQIRQLVFGQAKLSGLPVVLVTHDIQDAEEADGKTILL